MLPEPCVCCRISVAMMTPTRRIESSHSRRVRAPDDILPLLEQPGVRCRRTNFHETALRWRVTLTSALSACAISVIISRTRASRSRRRTTSTLHGMASHARRVSTRDPGPCASRPALHQGRPEAHYPRHSTYQAQYSTLYTSANRVESALRHAGVRARAREGTSCANER